jgi:hypothetical protein
MTPKETVAEEVQVLLCVVGEVWESEPLVKRDPGKALTFAQDEILVERGPFTVKIMPLPTAIISATA